MATTTAARESTASQPRVPVWVRRLDSPLTTYYLLVAVTVLLVVIGLVMVMSASSVTSIVETDNRTAYAIFIKQAEFAAIGAVAMFVASRIGVAWWKRLAIPILLCAMGLQALAFVPGIGIEFQGNTNWIGIGPFTMQPSEIAKIALVLFGALVLATKQQRLQQVRHVVFPFVMPVAAAVIGLVLLGHDLGTALVLGAIVAGVVFAAGVPVRWFALVGVAFAAAATLLVVQSPNRLGRFDVWLGRDTDVNGAARQTTHGRYALADGGVFGLGLGGSREKWQWLPESHNDFIFAVIGEELGLPGTLAIIVLFAALAVACYRLVLRTDDLFVRLATAGVMTWVLVQAMINIGSVIGMLPVIGLPLPLVSSGGSSLVTTMFALGMLVSFARADPDCRAALTARPSALRRSLAVLPRRVGRR